LETWKRSVGAGFGWKVGIAVGGGGEKGRGYVLGLYVCEVERVGLRSKIYDFCHQGTEGGGKERDDARSCR